MAVRVLLAAVLLLARLHRGTGQVATALRQLAHQRNHERRAGRRARTPAERTRLPRVIPSDVISGLAGTPIDGAGEGRHAGMVWCTFRIVQVRFTNSSDEESFAQRRARHFGQIGPTDPGWVEMPDLYDEAHRNVQGAESIVRSFIAARQGSVEVWVDWGVHAPSMESGFQERLLATVFERLG